MPAVKTARRRSFLSIGTGCTPSAALAIGSTSAATTNETRLSTSLRGGFGWTREEPKMCSSSLPTSAIIPVSTAESDPVVLQFDHVRGKTRELAEMLNSGSNWDRIIAEIEKCEVRCANCHWRRHAKEIGWRKVVLAASVGQEAAGCKIPRLNGERNAAMVGFRAMAPSSIG